MFKLGVVLDGVYEERVTPLEADDDSDEEDDAGDCHEAEVPVPVEVDEGG